jgi:hypothetical protein
MWQRYGDVIFGPRICKTVTSSSPLLALMKKNTMLEAHMVKKLNLANDHISLKADHPPPPSFQIKLVNISIATS